MKKSVVLEILLFTISAFAVLWFSSIPNQLGEYLETEKIVFRGIYTDTADYSVHLSMMQAGREGALAYQFRFTTEPHASAYLRLFYIALGHISRWFNMDVEIVFYISRWLFGLTALSAIYLLFRRIFHEKIRAYYTFFLAVLGGGLGWLQLILGAPLNPISPVDLWLIDAYVLFSISLFPSFSFTLTLMALAFFFFLGFMENGKWRNIAWVCLLAVTGQFINPIAFAVVDLSMAGVVLFTWWKQHRVEFKHGAALILIAISQAPLLIYNFTILTQDPVWSQFTHQNETLSPPPTFYFWGFAPLWIFAIPGMVRAFRERRPVFGALSLWVVGGFALAYMPVLIQRRFLLGITIPLAVLSIYGLEFAMGKIPVRMDFIKKRENLICFIYLLFASISSLFLILNASLFVSSQPDSLFYSRDVDAAIQWLDKNTSPNEFVLADVETSQIIAQKTHLKVYVGHEMETLFFHNKNSAMRAYFKGIISDEWISQTPIRWIVHGPYEEEINSAFTPDLKLDLAYQNDSVRIYRVDQ